MKREFLCEFETISDDEFNINNLVDEVCKRVEKIKEIKFGTCPIILFDWKEKGLEIDLTKGTVEIVDFSNYKMPSSFMKISGSKAIIYG